MTTVRRVVTFNRDDRPARCSTVTTVRPRREFNRDDRPARSFNRDDRGPRRDFNRDDRRPSRPDFDRGREQNYMDPDIERAEADTWTKATHKSVNGPSR